MSIVNEVNCSSSFQIKYLIISYAEYVEQAVHLTNHEDHAHHRDHADRSDFAFQVFLMFDNTCCFLVALLDNTWLCTVHNTFFYCVLLSEGIEAGLVLYIPGLQTQEKCKYNVYNFKTSAILQLVEIQNQCKYKTHSFLINGNFLQRQNYWPKLLHLKCMTNIFWSLTDLGEIIESTPFPSLTFFGNFISYVHNVHMEEIELQKRVFACFANTSCANRRKCKRRLMQSLLIVTTSQQLRQIMKTLSNRFISFTRSEIPFNTATLTNLILSNGRGGAVEC